MNVKKWGKMEKEKEKPDKMVNIVEEILEFNRQNEEGQRLKILSPDQMLKKLPSSLAEWEAEYNSKNLKNEIRQILYSLHSSKI